MKHYLLLIFTSLLFLKPAQAQTTFQKTYGSTGYDYATDVIQTADKGYAVMGIMNNSGVYFLKTDSLGNKQWSKNFGLYTPLYQFRAFAQTSDGGFIFAGYISYSSNYYSYVVKLDASGNVTWSKMHVAMSRIVSIKQTIEGDYIAVGLQYFGGKSTLVRFNSSGNILWSRTLPTTNYSMDVIQLASDSSFITAYMANNPTDNATFSRWGKNGALIWSKKLNSPNVSGGTGHGHLHESGNEVQVSVNSGSCPGILKINKDGSSAKLIGLNCQLYNYRSEDAYPAPNKGSVIVAQYNIGTGYGTRNILLAYMDSLGTYKWAKPFGGVNDEVPAAVKRTKDKGFVVVGSTKSYSAGYDDIYLIKTDSIGQSGCNTSVITFSSTSMAGSLSTYTGTVDSLFNNVTSTQTVTISNPAEISYDACSCVSPVASFTPDMFGSMNDNSTWATTWYWTCTCMPGNVDSTTMNKSYYGGPFPNGTYTVCLTVKNSCGMDSLCQPFNYTFYPIGIEETTESAMTSFYPNPIQDKLMIARNGTGTNMEAIRIRIINSLGALVYADKMEGALKEIRLDGLAPGLYFIQFSSGNKTISKKVIKE
jgi:hypothetical protein